MKPSTGYNETEARILFKLAAGAYSLNPEYCVDQTFPLYSLRQIYLHTGKICDEFTNKCASYALADDFSHRLYIVFRGTTSKLQLLTEAWHSLQDTADFHDIGKANKYFVNALRAFWPDIEEALVRYPDYHVTFTGHSLGGALASLAALKTVYFGLRGSTGVELYTFGQPRVGNVVLARKHDLLVPRSYRIVHSIDIVPHLPGCAVDDILQSVSQPCDPRDLDRPYHHGIEIFYPHEMEPLSPYRECLGHPFGEDFRCSDALNFIPENYFQYIYAHRHYFGRKISAYGKLGCNSTREAEKRLSGDFMDEPHHISFRSIVKGLQFAAELLG